MRPRISPAALLVKVTARMLCGETPSTWHNQASRWISTRVLPLPAPARTSTGPTGAVTAARCASFSESRMGDKSMGRAFYTAPGGSGPRRWDVAARRADQFHDQADE